MRRWIAELLRAVDPSIDGPSAIALSAFVHMRDAPGALERTVGACQPRVVLFLDEPAWAAARWQARPVAHHVPDPHRDGQVYEGWWGPTPSGLVVGKAPQHPSAHRFYRWTDMARFLRSVPAARSA